MCIDVYIIDKEKNTKLAGQVITFLIDKSNNCQAVVLLKNGEFCTAKLSQLKTRTKWN